MHVVCTVRRKCLVARIYALPQTEVIHIFPTPSYAKSREYCAIQQQYVVVPTMNFHEESLLTRPSTCVYFIIFCYKSILLQPIGENLRAQKFLKALDSSVIGENTLNGMSTRTVLRFLRSRFLFRVTLHPTSCCPKPAVLLRQKNPRPTVYTTIVMEESGVALKGRWTSEEPAGLLAYFYCDAIAKTEGHSQTLQETVRLAYKEVRERAISNIGPSNRGR